MNARLYTITYDALQPAQFERYDNSGIKTAEQKSYLFEYNPILDILGRSIEEEYLGIFSYKFAIKCGSPKRPMTKSRLMLLLESRPGQDAYGLSPMHRPEYFGFRFAEENHPGFSEIFFPLCEELRLPTEEPRHMINSNFFVAKTSLYREYARDAIAPAIELLDGKMRHLAHRPCRYLSGSPDIERLCGIPHYTFHSFVLERLAAQYLMKRQASFAQLNDAVWF